MVKRKAFLANPKRQYLVFQCGEHDCSPHTKRMEIIMGIQVWLISRMNIKYNENGGKKRFCYKSKVQYHASQYGEQDCCANNEKNVDYNKYLSLSHLADEH